MGQAVGGPEGILGWVAQYGQYIAFFVQLLYWVVIAGAAVFAAWQAKRFVDHACGVVPKNGSAEGDETVSVEEFTD